jgi:hypothetical protein
VLRRTAPYGKNCPRQHGSGPKKIVRLSSVERPDPADSEEMALPRDLRIYDKKRRNRGRAAEPGPGQLDLETDGEISLIPIPVPADGRNLGWTHPR